jgi:mitotic spindle assembly checkpoint protein MAD2
VKIVSSDDQVKAYIKKIMSQLDRWMVGGKISKLVIVITNKDTGEHVERWQFDVSFHVLSITTLSALTPLLQQVQIFKSASKKKSSSKTADQENAAAYVHPHPPMPVPTH